MLVGWYTTFQANLRQLLSGSKLNKEDLKLILNKVKTIAIVGASSSPDRDSYKVMKFLIDHEYQIYPVNPNETNILGRKCYPTLKSIEEKIDMVDVFRAEEFVFDITTEAIEIDAKILWTQEGIINEKAASLGRSFGLKVVMDKCPKKVLKA